MGAWEQDGTLFVTFRCKSQVKLGSLSLLSLDSWVFISLPKINNCCLCSQTKAFLPLAEHEDKQGRKGSMVWAQVCRMAFAEQKKRRAGLDPLDPSCSQHPLSSSLCVILLLCRRRVLLVVRRHPNHNHTSRVFQVFVGDTNPCQGTPECPTNALYL